MPMGSPRLFFKSRLLDIRPSWSQTVIYMGLVLFAIGSFMAATAIDIYWGIAGRVIQGTGAIPRLSWHLPRI